MNGDTPQVTPDPDLGAARKYTVKGKEKLDDAEWADAAEFDVTTRRLDLHRLDNPGR